MKQTPNAQRPTSKTEVNPPIRDIRVIRGSPPDRNSPAALQQRLARAEEMLTKSLNVIAAMQPVVSAVERYFDSRTNIEGITGMGEALASYRTHIKAYALQSKAIRPADHRGSPGEGDQTAETPQPAAHAGS